jgi:hypothetical protein
VSPAEVKNPPAVTVKENTAKVSETFNVAVQKASAETSSVSNLKADLMQRSLTTELSARSEKLNKIATDLLPKAHTMINESGKDPKKFISRLQEELKTPAYANLISMPDGDIEAIAFLVLMQASKSAQEDLKSIMDGVKNINKSKQHWRESIEQASNHPKSNDDDD